MNLSAGVLQVSSPKQHRLEGPWKRVFSAVAPADTGGPLQESSEDLAFPPGAGTRVLMELAQGGWWTNASFTGAATCIMFLLAAQSSFWSAEAT